MEREGAVKTGVRGSHGGAPSGGTERTLVARWPETAPYLLALLRIVAGLMFFLSGTMKLFAFPAGMPPDNSTASLATEVGIGGLLEVVGGALLVIGLFTRPAAFILSGEMAVAYFQFASPTGFWPVRNGGVTSALYCFVWLYFSAAGAGPWSVDAWRATHRR
jgi:putative oxidoreductase